MINSSYFKKPHHEILVLSLFVLGVGGFVHVEGWFFRDANEW
jgi:hypothetical protein